MLQNILPSNALHIENAVDIVLRWQKRNVALVGLSFKGGTDDLRESPHVVMAEKLIGKGMNLKIYDPTVNFSRLIGANRRYIEQTIPHIASLMCNDRKEVINSADTIIIAHKDAVFMDTFYSLCRTNQFILDLVGCVEKTKIPSTYKGICW
jgi:GDP-mannose 6-dehydrogenase